MSFLNELYSLFFRVRDLSQKMGYGQGHMQMGLAEKKGLFTCFIYLVYLPLSLCTDILSKKNYSWLRYNLKTFFKTVKG